MKRVIALAMVLVFAVAVAAQAQEPQSPTNAPAAPAAGNKTGNIFSMASIQKTLSADRALMSVPSTPAPVPKEGSKSFFKTPWPYVIAGAVVAGVVVAVNHKSSSNGMTTTGGSGY